MGAVILCSWCRHTHLGRGADMKQCLTLALVEAVGGSPLVDTGVNSPLVDTGVNTPLVGVVGDSPLVGVVGGSPLVGVVGDSPLVGVGIQEGGQSSEHPLLMGRTFVLNLNDAHLAAPYLVECMAVGGHRWAGHPAVYWLTLFLKDDIEIKE